MPENTSVTENPDDASQRLDIHQFVANTLTLISKKEFAKCNLLNQILIVVWQLTNGSKIIHPHPYTITLCINTIMGKKTAPRRGTKKWKEYVDKGVRIKNEGCQQRRVENYLNIKYPTFFLEGTDSAIKQGIEDAFKDVLSGRGINHQKIVSFKETAYLVHSLLIYTDNFHISSENVTKAIDETIFAFCGTLSEPDENKEKAQYAETLETLVNDKYFKYNDDNFLAVHHDVRMNREECYFRFVLERAKEEVKFRGYLADRELI